MAEVWGVAEVWGMTEVWGMAEGVRELDHLDLTPGGSTIGTANANTN